MDVPCGKCVEKKWIVTFSVTVARGGSWAAAAIRTPFGNSFVGGT
ncbi:hypothetical protein FACS1894200_08610 [Spirochaetia bacterium]|nr:hypothetical protein FACS1894200_08610 [Spirochaetia bacterium]